MIDDPTREDTTGVDSESDVELLMTGHDGETKTSANKAIL